MMSKNMEEAQILVLDHYVKHHKIVYLKLNHAKTATKQSLEHTLNASNDNTLETVQEISRYEKIWNSILKDFDKIGCSEEELLAVEKALALIPKIIKVFYDELVRQDKVIQKLSKELSHKKYQEAFAIVKSAQGTKDSLSGLDSKEFDYQEADVEITSIEDIGTFLHKNQEI